MLPEFLAATVATLIPLLIGAIVVCTLASISDTILRLRWRNLRRDLAQFLLLVHKAKIPSGESDKQIHARCRRDAARILRTPDGSRLTWLHPELLQHVVVRETNFDPELAPEIGQKFSGRGPAMRKRYALIMRLWVIAWAFLLSLVYLVFLPATGNAPLENWLENLPKFQFAHFGMMPDLLLATLFVTIGAHLCFRVFRKELGDSSEFEPSPVFPRQATAEKEGMIGRDKCAVRAINFAGGGFSTIMQLGVTHALMTIQGRAPDAVIGVSAGAIHAAALAEVLQAGDGIEEKYQPWDGLGDDKKLELQMKRMQARVMRFREFLVEYQTVRERLYDSLLPDAYQVDSHDPLEPLQSPLHDRKERQARLSSLETQSGLVRLYNDLLRLKIPVGIIVRIIRRVLGFQAAGNLHYWLFRNYTRVLESMKIWLLLGSVLMRASPILGPLRRALFSGAALKVTPSTAESIIFKFNVARNLGKWLEHSVNFLILLTLWLAFGLTPAMMIAWVLDPLDRTGEFIVMVVVIYWGTPLVISLAFHQSLAAFSTTSRGLLQAFWLVSKWTAVLYLIVAASVTLAGAVTVAVTFQDMTLFGVIAESTWDFDLLVNIIRYIPLFAVTVIILLALRYLRKGFQKLQVLMGNADSPNETTLIDRLLASYQLSTSLFSSYPMKTFFTRLFDKNYYGKVDMDSAIATALIDKPTSSDRTFAKAKTVGYYSQAERPTPIHVGLAVANVGDGRLEIIPPKVPVVDGLVTAFAVAPLFPPQVLGNRLFLDGTNVANVPTRALLSMLRNRVNPKSRGVHIYSVVPLPFSRPFLYSEDKQKLCLSLWDIAMKALFLQRFRDAVLERRLTDLYTRLIPGKDENGNPTYSLTIGTGSGARQFFRAWVTPIELEEPISLNERILTATKEERHSAILETVADGCRASMETMIRLNFSRPVRCRLAVRQHLAGQIPTAKLTTEIVNMEMPGSDLLGPGLKEVCEHCVLNRDGNNPRPQTLQLRKLPEDRPPWPHERSDSDPDFSEPPMGSSESAGDPKNDPFHSLRGWPRKGRGEPTISMLFSGGVFRGVYQMGVLNALNLLHLKPDVIAGASVGSITAGMITKVFTGDDQQRQAGITRLASVYLGIDRLILTDRFADFVRNLTIRAAATKFSISEADDVFRKYDFPSPSGYSRSTRDVIAGIERLLYVNPYQLNALVNAIRHGKYKTAFKHVRDFAQQWLERMEVGEQVLGADALEALIEHFVIPEGSEGDAMPASFTAFDTKSIHLLATTTNVTRGQLEVLGGIDDDGGKRRGSGLLEGLLASSAFPGVFKPRLSYDIRPGTSVEHQYIDGGVMDNFPIDAVIQFLLAAQAWDRIDCGFDDPDRPHLIFAASLQINTPDYRHPDQWGPLRRSWPALLARTKELGYNTKLDTYEATERNLRDIYTTIRDEAREAGRKTDAASLGIGLTPLNIEVVTVKPEWLCGTFAFHPMLGFRRRNQAMSIAHGCASTLLRFKGIAVPFRRAWKINEKAIPVETGVGRAWEHWRKVRKKAGKDADGKCWLRPDEPCPFSRKSLTEMNKKLSKAKRPSVKAIEHLSTIYVLCTDPSTHMPKAASVGWFERFLRKREVIP